jgi:formiminotetrahydrofolate cyclodeaminase
MEYDNIDVNAVLSTMVAAVEHGKARPATKQESMAVRLAALSEIVYEMQNTVDNDERMLKTSAVGGII